MKVKPCQYGVKIWCLANAKSKFVHEMEVIVVQVMRMLSMQLGTRLSLGLWMGTRTKIALSHVIKKL
jgi:hypothetical protein